MYQTSVADQFVSDPDPLFQVMTDMDPDPAFQINSDPDPITETYPIRPYFETFSN